MLPRIDTNSLIVFYFVGREGSLTAAAELLYLTQPTVSYHIKTLENSVGLKLIEVKRQKVSLTRAGTGLFQYAKEVYQHVTDADSFLESLRETNLRVGVAVIFSQAVAGAAAKFMELYPKVKLIVRNGTSQDVTLDVLDSRVDLGIIVDIKESNPKLKAVRVSGDEEVVLVASPLSSICDKEVLQLSDLYDFPMVAGPATSAFAQALILQKFKDEGLEKPPPIIAEVDSIEWGMSLVEAGNGVGIYPLRTVKDKVAEGRLMLLPLAKDMAINVNAIVRAGAPEHPFTEDFINRVKISFNMV